jgi:hypothetical protein
MPSSSDGMMESYLARSVTPPLAAIVGSRLTRVNYWCLQWEWGAEEINDPLFYTGGDVELEFANSVDIYVHWKQNAVSRGDSGVVTGFHSVARTYTYERLEATEAPVWRQVIGDVLQRVEVLGWNLWADGDDEVRVIRFCFRKQDIYVGVGHKTEGFRMGDDLLVRSEEDFFLWPDAKKGKVLWSAGEME